MLQKIHKPQVRMVSKVKMGGNFWPSVRMRDMFRVDEHCEKKQTNTYKNVCQNFEELWVVSYIKKCKPKSNTTPHKKKKNPKKPNHSSQKTNQTKTNQKNHQPNEKKRKTTTTTKNSKPSSNRKGRVWSSSYIFALKLWMLEITEETDRHNSA